MGVFTAYKKQSDEQLMLLICRKDTRAFEELYSRYSKRLFHFMLKMLNNDDEKANDLLQDLFLKLVERPHLFDTNKKFYTWIFTVAANMCRTQYRMDQPERMSSNSKEISNKSSDEEMIHQMDGKIFSIHLERALEELTYEQKETFVLRFQEEFSIHEISEMMNCSVGTVKSRIHYTTRKLAIELEAFKPLLKK